MLGILYNKGVFPDAVLPNPSLLPEDRISWYATVSSYIDLQIWNDLDRNQSWNGSAINHRIATWRIGVMTCPLAPAAASGALQPASYIGIAGRGTDAPLLAKSHPRAGVFGYSRNTALADIKDGAANTLLIAETANATGSWLQGGPATVRGIDPAQKPYIGPNRQFGGLHAGGAWVAMADGSVRWVSDSMSPTVFEALSTMAGGETLPKDW